MKIGSSVLEIPSIKDGKNLGIHIIIEFFNCDASSMNNIDDVTNIFVLAAESGNCNIVSKHNHLFDPHGISGVLILSESHISWHLWQEHAYAAIDLFYCSDEVDANEIIEKLSNYFKPVIKNIQLIPRGKNIYKDLFY